MDASTEECTFSNLILDQEFIDPALPRCVMRVTVLSAPGLAGEYYCDEINTRFAAGHNKRVLRFIV